MFAKKHPTERGILLAVSDEELLGRSFSEKSFRLEITEDFYGGQRVSEEELKPLMKEAYILNIVGKKSVEIAVKLGLVNKEEILVIGGIPHAQSIIIRE